MATHGRDACLLFFCALLGACSSSTGEGAEKGAELERTLRERYTERMPTMDASGWPQKTG